MKKNKTRLDYPLEQQIRRSTLDQLRVLLDLMNGKQPKGGKRSGASIGNLSYMGFIQPNGTQTRRVIWKINPKVLRYKQLIEDINAY